MPGPRPRRTASVDGDARKLILDAAEELFAARGFDATATAAIAAQAGVPKGLVFYYFPTKESLLTTLVAERLPADPLADVADLVVTGEPESTLVNLDAALNLRDHHSSVMRVIIWREADTHPAIREHLRRLRSYLHDATIEVLRASSPFAASSPGARLQRHRLGGRDVRRRRRRAACATSTNWPGTAPRTCATSRDWWSRGWPSSAGQARRVRKHLPAS